MAGLKATIITALTEPKSFNGDITLTAVIDMDKGSFSKFGLIGNAFFVTDYPANKNPFVKAAVDASYDIPSTTFNLNATVDAKFASVTARVPIGVYADPSTWFVKVGDPFGERVSFTFLDMSSAVLKAKLNANAYLAAGNVLDGGLPPLPAEVTGMNGMPSSNPETARLISDINSKPGGGFALGAQVRGDFRASFLMLYAQAKAILGFDLMMKHFTEPIECGGTTGGINNWYAIGQLYAFFPFHSPRAISFSGRLLYLLVANTKLYTGWSKAFAWAMVAVRLATVIWPSAPSLRVLSLTLVEMFRPCRSVLAPVLPSCGFGQKMTLYVASFCNCAGSLY